MKKLLFAAAISLSTVSTGVAVACDDSAPAAEATIVTPAQVNALLAAGATTPVDVNSAETRASLGTLPGAVLLSGHEYAMSELPEDTGAPLVFYCGSERCSAAPQAAAAAIAAGYTNVSVMSAGIRGWVGAGYGVEGGAASTNSGT